MPILEPDLVRRSARSSTIAASRPAEAPRLTAATNSLQRDTRRRFRNAAISVERMAGEEKPGRFEFAPQQLGRWSRAAPWAARDPRPRLRRTARFGPAALVGVAVGAGEDRSRSPANARARSGSSSSKAPQQARFSSTFLLTSRGLIRRAKSARLANGRSPRDATIEAACPSPTPLIAPKRVADRELCRPRRAPRRNRRPSGMIDGGSTTMPEAPRLVAKLGELVGVALVEGHRRGEEFDRIMRLEPGGLIGDQRIGRRMALVEAVVGEFRQAGRRFHWPCRASRPRSMAPPTKRSRCASISDLIFLPMARRRLSASPSE